MATTYQQPKLEMRRDVPRPHWRLRLYIETPQGLRRRNFIVGYRDEMTLKQARRKRLELLAKANRGDLLDPGGMKFSDLVQRFRELRMATVKASTAGFYRQHLDHHLMPHFGEYSLDRIGRLQVEQFVATLSKLSWSTRKGVMATLSAVLAAGVEWRLLEYNATIGVKLGKRAAKYAKAIPTPAQFQALAEALDANTGLLVRMLAITGVRVSEAIALRWSDVDWDRQTVAVTKRWYRGTGLDAPKSAASARPRWIGPLVTALQIWRPEHDCYIFGGAQPIDERGVLRSQLRPVLRKLGLPVGSGWHMMRRLHTSLLQAAGASPIESGKLVGHVSQVMTANYTVVSAARESELVNGVAQRLLAS